MQSAGRTGSAADLGDQIRCAEAADFFVIGQRDMDRRGGRATP